MNVITSQIQLLLADKESININKVTIRIINTHINIFMQDNANQSTTIHTHTHTWAVYTLQDVCLGYEMVPLPCITDMFQKP